MEPPAEAPEPPASDALVAAGDLLRALAAPVRIAIVLQLRTSPRCVHELVDALAVTQPLISQHLRVLKAAGVVRGDRRGREVVYRLVDDHLEGCHRRGRHAAPRESPAPLISPLPPDPPSP